MLISALGPGLKKASIFCRKINESGVLKRLDKSIEKQTEKNKEQLKQFLEKEKKVLVR